MSATLAFKPSTEAQDDSCSPDASPCRLPWRLGWPPSLVGAEPHLGARRRADAWSRASPVPRFTAASFRRRLRAAALPTGGGLDLGDASADSRRGPRPARQATAASPSTLREVPAGGSLSEATLLFLLRRSGKALLPPATPAACGGRGATRNSRSTACRSGPDAGSRLGALAGAFSAALTAHPPGRRCRSSLNAVSCAASRGRQRMEFSGRRVLVTGAGKGIGCATVTAAARGGRRRGGADPQRERPRRPARQPAARRSSATSPTPTRRATPPSPPSPSTSSSTMPARPSSSRSSTRTVETFD